MRHRVGVYREYHEIWFGLSHKQMGRMRTSISAFELTSAMYELIGCFKFGL